eukprot:COSAG01_NODE_3630_length_5848_cov_14.340929_2_plen_789_part_00
MASAPWQPLAADDPRAIGLKNGGLSDMSSDILYPASRMVDGDFKAGSTLEFRYRSDSSRHWLPRESRLFVEYKIKLGETAATGSGTNKNLFVNTGAKAPQTLDASVQGRGSGAPPNANLALTAAPNASLFEQVRFVQNSVTIENNPSYYTTAVAQLLTKTDRAGSDTTGSGMLNSLRKDHGKMLSDREDHPELKWDSIRELRPTSARTAMNSGAVADSTFTAGLDGDFRLSTQTNTFTIVANAGNVCAAGDIISQAATGAVGVVLEAVAEASTTMKVDVFKGTFNVTDVVIKTTAGVAKATIPTARVTSYVAAFPNADNGSSVATPLSLAHALARQKPYARDGGFPNPKCSILQMGYNESTGEITVQVAEPIFLSTWAHPYAIPSSDFQLHLQISRDWLADLFYCSDYSYGCAAGRGSAISPIPSSGKIEMGQIYVNVSKVELHCSFLSPMVPQIPKSIGIKTTAMQVATRLLQSKTVQEQIVVPPSCRAVYLFLRQRYHHVCACAEELGRAGIGFNSMVTTLPSVTKAGGQPNPNKQGRAVPHNKSTIKAGTSDGWIRESEIDTTTTGISSEGYSGRVRWEEGVPKGTSSTAGNLSTEAAGDYNSFNKYSDSNSDITFAADTTAGTSSVAVTTPKWSQLTNEETTFWTDCQVQLGSATAPTQPYSELDPTVGKMIRPFNDMISALGKPLGLRGSQMTFEEYCGHYNANGPSAASNGCGPGCAGLFLRILNPPNSLSNVLTVRGTLAAEPKADAQMELVALVLHDNFLTCEWQPPAEIPLRTQIRSIV